MLAHRRLPLALVLLTACGAGGAPTTGSVASPAPAIAPAGAEAPTVFVAAEGPPPAQVPPGMQWARGERYSLVVPTEAREISPARWEIAAESGPTPFNIGVSTAPFVGSADEYIHHELGNTSLMTRIAAGLADQPDAPGWRAWSVTNPGERTIVLMRARYVTDRARTVFALCVREERNAAQEALCTRTLASLRVGRAAEQSTTDPTLTTVSEDEAAVDVPSTWRRQSGNNIQYAPSAQSSPSERDMAVFLGINTNTANVNEVIDGSITGAQAQANTTVDVRERRVRRVGAGSEGALSLRSITQTPGYQVIGRAFSRSGWAWAVICLSPEGAPPTACTQSVASFRAIPR